jgi:hypothetical protein
MKKRMRAFATAAVMLSSVVGAAWAQRAAGLRVVRRVRPEAARDARLEAAIYHELYAGGVVTGLPERYLYNRVDLDGDGRPEVLAYVHGTSSCGSAGCLLLVYQRAGGGYELVSRINGAENPVFVSEWRTNGWRDLIAPVRWGEVEGRTVRDYHAVLAFDGGSYPEQFPGAEPLGAAARVRGVAYFAGELSERSGFALRARRGREW